MARFDGICQRLSCGNGGNPPTPVTSQCPISQYQLIELVLCFEPEPAELMASSWARVSALSPQVEKWLQSQTTWSEWGV